jgi:hypothetical protein
VKLTLLPMLASAAVAAQPAASDDSPQGPPGLTEPAVSPPGLTPTVDECRQQPDNPGCVVAPDPDGDDPRRLYIDGWVLRGGFGHYFWTSGG